MQVVQHGSIIYDGPTEPLGKLVLFGQKVVVNAPPENEEGPYGLHGQPGTIKGVSLYADGSVRSWRMAFSGQPFLGHPEAELSVAPQFVLGRLGEGE